MLLHSSPESARPMTASATEAEVRRKAEAVLASLMAAKAECDKQLADLRRTDPMKQVTGKSSLEEAIASTKRLLADLDKLAGDMRGRPVCEVEVRLTSPTWRRTAEVSAVA